MTCPHCNSTWLSSGFIHCQRCGHEMQLKTHMEVARRVFSEDDYEPSSMAELRRRRGYAKPAPYPPVLMPDFWKKELEKWHEQCVQQLQYFAKEQKHELVFRDVNLLPKYFAKEQKYVPYLPDNPA